MFVLLSFAAPMPEVPAAVPFYGAKVLIICVSANLCVINYCFAAIRVSIATMFDKGKNMRKIM